MSQAFVKENQQEGNIVVTTTIFQEGDRICHINNYKEGSMYGFFEATDYDVENYSGQNGDYIKIVN